MQMTSTMNYSIDQLKIIERDVRGSVFLSGYAGTGKTTAGIGRLKFLLNQGIPGHSILLLFPQRTLSTIYQEALNDLRLSATTLPAIATYGGLARRGIELFWPILSEKAGFLNPQLPPIFLTLESSLYFLSRTITPLIQENGFFSSLTIQRNRLFSQILDNLNKSAVHGFPPDEISLRLKSSWIGDPSQASVFDDAQESALVFRHYCLEHNLLDYSLQIEIFNKFLSPHDQYIDYFHRQYNHLIFDNLEEDVPVSHDFIRENLNQFVSSLLIFDLDAGYRSFLGASPQSAISLQSLCNDRFDFQENFTSSDALLEFIELFSSSYEGSTTSLPSAKRLGNTISIIYHPSYQELFSWVADEISTLVTNGATPSDIVILSPYLSDTMRFLLTSELEKRNIQSTSSRPSRAIRDEPTTNCLLTLAALSHPSWSVNLTQTDIAFALFQAIDQVDLTRAFLMAKHLVIRSQKEYELISFDSVKSDVQERITYFFGTLYQNLFNWISAYQDQPVMYLDHFFIRLFGEILSQPGYAFHEDIDKGKIVEQIISSIRNFRNTAGAVLGITEVGLGEEYFQMVKTGMLANQYPRFWHTRPMDSVYIAPAYTFLLSNTPADYQFWLDVGSRGWYERIFQPLTNPHILNRDWSIGDPWRDIEEIELNSKTMLQITSGLIRRCRYGIYFCLTETDERGFEQKGLLIQSLNKMYRSTAI